MIVVDLAFYVGKIRRDHESASFGGAGNRITVRFCGP
jgi:hypothetical protein